MNGIHRRFDPSRKELCVLDLVKGATLRGFRIFENASQIKVKHQFRTGEVPEDRIVNRNRSYYSPKSSNEFQHALLIIKGDNGYVSEAVPEPGARGRQLPKSNRHIAIVSGMNMSAAAPISQLNAYGVTFEVDAIGQNLAHEMGHACGEDHHGIADPTYRTFSSDNSVSPPRIVEQQLKDIAGKAILNVPRVPVRRFRENGQEIPATDPLIRTGYETWVAAHDKGQHSGVANCMMRYDNAGAYIHPKRPDARVLVPDAELPGLHFCDSGKGTLINDSGRQPWPRYGNAAEGRGNCQSQLCVRDSAW